MIIRKVKVFLSSSDSDSSSSNKDTGSSSGEEGGSIGSRFKRVGCISLLCLN